MPLFYRKITKSVLFSVLKKNYIFTTSSLHLREFPQNRSDQGEEFRRDDLIEEIILSCVFMDFISGCHISLDSGNFFPFPFPFPFLFPFSSSFYLQRRRSMVPILTSKYVFVLQCNDFLLGFAEPFRRSWCLIPTKGCRRSELLFLHSLYLFPCFSLIKQNSLS